MTSAPNKPPTIGVFDSGFGGLTVLRALLPLFPGAHFIYLGDTARLPYGAKSRETITRYALSSAAFLLAQGIDLLVIACNTASALALDELQRTLPIPVVGVIAPGTQAAARATIGEAEDTSEGALRLASDTWVPNFAPETGVPKSARILVLATAATVQSHSYRDSCAGLGLIAHEMACPLLVPLVEEGWTTHEVTRQVLAIYLQQALAEAPEAQTLLLGCTHYPLLEPMIRQTLADLQQPMHLVDSAAATAQAAAALLPHPIQGAPPTCTFYATDSIEKFRRLGTHFLGQPLPEVHLLDLGG